jgi:chromosome segregation ATPase
MSIGRGGANAMAAVIKDEAEMDPNIEVLQASIERVAADVSDVKAEVRDLRDKQGELRDRMDAFRERVDAKIDGLRTELRGEIDGSRTELRGEINGLRKEVGEVRDKVAALSVTVERGFHRMTVSMFVIAGGLLGVMAKACGWF